MDKVQLWENKRRLIKKKKEMQKLLNHIESHGLDYPLSNSIGELSAYDNHPADIGDEIFERSKDLSLRENAQRQIEKIDAALEAIKRGTYGICSICGNEIPRDRLAVLPQATTCEACSSESHEGDRSDRPLEEEVVIPPFNFQTEQDFGGGENQIIYDGEDTWQEVARYGSSDTPQDVPDSKKYPNIWPDEGEHLGSVDYLDSIPYRKGEDGMIYKE